jgi:hypothetical protein
MVKVALIESFGWLEGERQIAETEEIEANTAKIPVIQLLLSGLVQQLREARVFKSQNRERFFLRVL